MHAQAAWNNSGNIGWQELDRALIDGWFRKANQAQGVERFLFSFICLNHYYTAWAANSQPQSRVERHIVRHLGKLDTLASRWPDFIQLHDVSGRTISLPLMDWNNRVVPLNFVQDPGDYEASDLTIEDYLEVVYQLRCDLFHASRSTAGFRNQMAIRFVADASLNLVKYLIGDTRPQGG